MGSRPSTVLRPGAPAASPAPPPGLRAAGPRRAMTASRPARQSGRSRRAPPRRPEWRRLLSPRIVFERRPAQRAGSWSSTPASMACPAPAARTPAQVGAPPPAAVSRPADIAGVPAGRVSRSRRAPAASASAPRNAIVSTTAARQSGARHQVRLDRLRAPASSRPSAYSARCSASGHPVGTPRASTSGGDAVPLGRSFSATRWLPCPPASDDGRGAAG